MAFVPKTPDQKREELEGLVRQIEEQTLKVMTSHGFKHYLETFAKFHNYSLNNILLIQAQRPTATRVAGFHTWTEVGRYVSKGEKGICIFIPCIKKVREEMKDQAIEEKKESAEAQKQLVGFIVGRVFDIAQTAGKELPRLKHELGQGGEVPKELFDGLESFAQKVGIPLKREVLSGAKGYYSRKTNEIVLDENLSQAHRFSVLCHELAHGLLHNVAATKDRPRLTSADAELEAEAVAFVVSTRAGIKTDLDAATYIAAHQKQSDPREVMRSFKESTERIMRVSNEIIHSLNLQVVLTPELDKTVKTSKGLRR